MNSKWWMVCTALIYKLMGARRQKRLVPYVLSLNVQSLKTTVDNTDSLRSKNKTCFNYTIICTQI